MVLRRPLPIALAVLVLLAVCHTAWAQLESPRTVLVVYWGAEHYPTNLVEDAAIRDALLSSSDLAIAYYAEYLESEEFPTEDASLALRDYILRKYRGRRIDVVLAITDVALQFVLRFRGELFPEAPVVYHGTIEADAKLRSAGGGLTGVVIGGVLNETLELALKLHPSTERVFVVVPAPDRAFEDMLRAQVQAFARRIEIAHITEGSLPRLVAAVKGVPARSLILYVRHSQEEAGRVVPSSEIARLVAHVSPVPVYGISDSSIGSGIVGGAVYETLALGTRVGEIARQVLDGRRPEDIPMEHAETVPMFDWRQLRRWQIPESSLPVGSIVRFRESSTWERQRAVVLVAGAVLLMQSGLIAALLFERRSRRRSQAALREIEERAEIAGVSLGVGFWTWEPEKDRVWMTRQCAWLLGAASGRPLTLDGFLATLRAPTRGPVENAFERAVRNGAPFDGEWPVAREESVRWIAAATRPSADSRGRRQVTGVVMDITARKTAELQAEEHRRELSHLGRVAMLGEMTGALAHELRQPLTAILHYAQGARRLIETPPLDLDKVRQGLDAIVRADTHAGGVIERVRALLKRSDPQREPLDINEAVREILELASVEFRARGVVPAMQLAGDLPKVLGDRIQLQQVLMNLVMNACDAMNAIEPARRLLTVTTSSDDEQIQILVRDAGIGIPAERLDRVFEPFVTTKEDGLGLGLAICRSIVRAHGGEIQAWNNPEGGTTFQVSLLRTARDPNTKCDA